MTRVVVLAAAVCSALLLCIPSTTSLAIPCNHGQIISTAEGDVCQCWGAIYDMGIYSNTFYGAACNKECRPYCSGRGMCSISEPGVCTCDDPMHWEGDRCELRTATGLPGEYCSENAECASGVCAFGVCNPATCTDGVLNQDETDIDCGGSCGPCPSDDECTTGTDCVSGVCTDGTCMAATCTDGVKNGVESDTDCGGECGPCGVGQACGHDSDCGTCHCGSSVCSAAPVACGEVSECQLRRFMVPDGGASACPLCSVYLPFLNAALREYDMTCPVRYAALLSVIREGSGSLQRPLAPTAGNAAGGAIPLIPANVRAACRAVPSLRAGFSAEFESCAALEAAKAGGGDVCTCGSDSEIVVVAARPAFAFHTAAWWFAAGAQASQGSACSDLRAVADEGRGVAPATLPPTTGDAGTGMHRILPCTVAGGFGGSYSTVAASSVLESYDAGRALWDPLYPTCGTGSGTCPAGQHYASAAPATCGGRSCASCTACSSGDFQIGGCVNVFARQCQTCTTCADGLAVLTPCSATADTVCTQCSVCADGTYETRACTATLDRECAACSICDADEWQSGPCGGTDDTQCTACLAPQPTFPDCQAELTISAADMISLAGCDAADTACQDLRTPFKAALVRFNMSCPLRAAALAAQIRFATAFAPINFKRQIGSGPGAPAVWLGGAIPLLPENARTYCRDSADVTALFNTELGAGCDAATADPADPCACGTDEEVATILARQDMAFRSAAWWFARGSHRALGSPCDDLRGDSDYGIGAFGLPAPSRETPGVGFRKISSCILGFGVDTSAAAREAMYLEAMRVFDAGYLRCPVPAHAWPSCSDGIRNGLEPGVDCGGTCGTRCEAGQGCFVDSDCINSGPADADRHKCDAVTKTCRLVSTEEQCSDGLRNGDELGVDCGGSCGATCEAGVACTGPQDCLSGACKQGVCADCVYGDNVNGVCTCWGANPGAGTLSTSYYGIDCANKCRDDLCYGRGMCSSSTANECLCDEPLRFQGSRCELSTCGHGYAVYQTPTTVTCTCSEGWTGDKCDTPVACVHGDWIGGTCNCLPGWSGVGCTVPVGFVAKCLHGVWDSTNYECVCNTPWIGGKCERVWVEPVATTDCFMGSRDNSSVPCECDPFWSGTACNTTSCGYGQITLPATGGPPTCECMDTTWGGDGCSISTRGDCLYSGAWDAASSSCACDFGFSGAQCQVQEWDANGSSGRNAGFLVVAQSIDGADPAARLRAVHAPAMCTVALTEPGDICFPFELAVLSNTGVTATVTLDSDVVSSLSASQRGDLKLQKRTTSAAAAIGVDTGDQTTLGQPDGACTAVVSSLDAATGTLEATLCPGEFYYITFAASGDADGSSGFGGIGNSGLGDGISGQQVTDLFSAATSAAPGRTLALVCSALALFAVHAWRQQ